MDIASGLTLVALPDGEVTISTTPLEWWTQQNGTGFVDPNNIAPDPKNVRRRMSESKMAELRASVKQHGVRQPMNMTPLHLAPWVKVDKKYRDCFFLAVGGHRRREASVEEDIGAVPIIIKIYPSEKEHRLDVSLLNKGNEDLSDLEKGYEIVSLQAVGWKIEELCKEFNCSAPYLYARKHLTMLHPSLQALLDPDLPFKERLGTISGGELGSTKEPTLEELDDFYRLLEDELHSVPKTSIVAYRDIEELDGDGRRFAMQRALYAVIKLKGLSSDRAKAFISEHRLKLGAVGQSGGKKTQSYQPKRRKDVVMNVIASVHGSIPAGWRELDWVKMFELSSKEETDAFVASIRTAERVFTKWADTVDRIARNKKATRPEVLKLMEKSK